MRRKYSDCKREDGNCAHCDLVAGGLDCHSRRISNLELLRRSKGLEQGQLSEMSGVNIRQIRRVELGEAEAGNLTARNLIAIASVLGVDPADLI